MAAYLMNSVAKADTSPLRSMLTRQPSTTSPLLGVSIRTSNRTLGSSIRPFDRLLILEEAQVCKVQQAVSHVALLRGVLQRSERVRQLVWVLSSCASENMFAQFNHTQQASYSKIDMGARHGLRSMIYSTHQAIVEVKVGVIVDNRPESSNKGTHTLHTKGPAI